MSVVIACCFPIILVILLLKFFPANILPKNPLIELESIVNTEPLAYSEHLKYGLPMLIAAFAVTYPMSVFQRMLFEIAGNNSEWYFSYRVTDLLVYSFLPGFFLSLVAVFPFYLRLLVRFFGERIYDILDRPDRSSVPMTLRQEIRLMPKLSIIIGIAASILNFLAFDTFFQIGERQVRYSTFFSLSTREVNISEINKAVLHSGRRAPNGQLQKRKWLELVLNNGETIDTYYLIEDEHIPKVIDVLAQSGSGNIDMEYKKGQKI